MRRSSRVFASRSVESVNDAKMSNILKRSNSAKRPHIVLKGFIERVLWNSVASG